MHSASDDSDTDVAELTADFVDALIGSSSSDEEDGGSAAAAADCPADNGGTGGTAGAAAAAGLHKYKLAAREFALEGLPLGLRLEQRYVAVNETGGAVYDAGVVLSRWLCSQPAVVRGLPVLELGCGPGLTALVAAALGAAEVLATDMDDSALALARDNLEAQECWLSQCPARACSPQCASYRWGAELSPALRSWLERVAEGTRGGVVLGADVLYDDASSFAALLFTLSRLLPPSSEAERGTAGKAAAPSSSSCCCLLCFPRRRAETESHYISALEKAFSVEWLDVGGRFSAGCGREMALLQLSAAKRHSPVQAS